MNMFGYMIRTSRCDVSGMLVFRFANPGVPLQRQMICAEPPGFLLKGLLVWGLHYQY